MSRSASVRVLALLLATVCLAEGPAAAFPDKPVEMTVLFGARPTRRGRTSGSFWRTRRRTRGRCAWATPAGAASRTYIGNVMLLLLNLPLVGIFARVASIPQRYLMPAVLVLCAVAAYADNNNAFDVRVMVGAGVLGYAMRGFGFDPAPLVLGLVLGPVLERSLLQALTIGRGDLRELWSSAPAAIMLAATAALLLAPIARAGLRLWTRGRAS